MKWIFFVFLFSLFLFSVIYSYAHPIEPGDFWWHLASGRWIWEHRALPGHDPFAYTTPADVSGWQDVILTSYWLAQTLMYLLYKTGSFFYVALFNALLFALILLAVWTILRFRGVDPYAGLALVALCAWLLRPFDSVRPQVYSFIFAPLLYAAFDGGLNKLRQGQSGRKLLFSLAFAPLVMLIWANCHRGFIMAYPMLAIIASVETLKSLLKRGLTGPRYIRFILWTGVTVGASLINPNAGVSVLTDMRELKDPLMKSVVEYLPPWEFAALVDMPYFVPGLAVVAALTTLCMAVSWRRLDPARVLLYLGFLTVSLKTARFSAFFIIMAPVLSAPYIAALTSRRIAPLRILGALTAAVFSIVFIAGGAEGFSRLRRGPGYYESPMIKAVGFLKTRNLPKPIFNPYIWGGRLIWELHPEYKVFIDERNLDRGVRTEYENARAGTYKDVFDRYGINTVIYMPVYPIEQLIPGLVVDLIKDCKWRLLYFDGGAVIFVREPLAAGEPALDKNLLKKHLIDFVGAKINRRPDSPALYRELGGLYFRLEEWDKAREAYGMAESMGGKK